jgi:hypothetical protein
MEYLKLVFIYFILFDLYIGDYSTARSINRSGFTTSVGTTFVLFLFYFFFFLEDTQHQKY